MAIGQTLSVVGGLIVGQAAISAGLTAPGSLVIIAISIMATFTMVNQSVVGTLSLLRIAVLIICSVFGIFGFMMALIGVLLFFANSRSFGVYYLTPLSPCPARHGQGPDSHAMAVMGRKSKHFETLFAQGERFLGWYEQSG